VRCWAIAPTKTLAKFAPIMRRRSIRRQGRSRGFDGIVRSGKKTLAGRWLIEWTLVGRCVAVPTRSYDRRGIQLPAPGFSSNAAPEKTIRSEFSLGWSETVRRVECGCPCFGFGMRQAKRKPTSIYLQSRHLVIKVTDKQRTWRSRSPKNTQLERAENQLRAGKNACAVWLSVFISYQSLLFPNEPQIRENPYRQETLAPTQPTTRENLLRPLGRS